MSEAESHCTNKEKVPVVTIDGPSGSGKGTIAARMAEILGYHLLDSGALYRLMALYCIQNDIDPEVADDAELEKIAEQLPAEFQQADVAAGPSQSAQKILLQNKDVSERIRSEEVGNAASKVAAIPAVRRGLLARQHAFRQPPGLVADGRDMGTVVFPDAVLKVFLDASAEERARRRAKQLSLQQESAKMDGLLQMIRQRDERDRQRAVAPLQPAEDAVYLDSSQLGIDEVIERVRQLATQRGLI